MNDKKEQMTDEEFESKAIRVLLIIEAIVVSVVWWWQ